MNKFVLLTEKTWHKLVYDNLKNRENEIWKLVDNKGDFNFEKLNNYQPDYIFIPHWSYKIPEKIWTAFPCVVFHMTDLPYGRGGSPLQNLIVRGHRATKISAIKVNKDIDSGDVYLKKDLNLEGTANEIFERATPIILEMIKEIIDNKLVPIRQKGNPVYFNRRKAEDSSIVDLKTLDSVYDYIRMLDCEGYPNAYIETEFLKFEFTDAQYSNNQITAYVRISKK